MRGATQPDDDMQSGGQWRMGGGESGGGQAPTASLTKATQREKATYAS